MDDIWLQDLIANNRESEWLDFKQAYYSPDQKASMAHDLICMANANHSADRFILLGVADDGEIVGLQASVADHNFWSDIRSFPVNHTLPVDYQEIELFDDDGTKLVGVIRIRDSDKQPFFLTKEFTKQNRTVRPGVAYSRSGSNNTPIDSTPHDAEVERMWRKRFGLDHPPLEQARRLLRDVNSWVSSESPDTENSLQYHKDHPEYVLELKLRQDIRPGEFWEPWIERIQNDWKRGNARQTSGWRFFVRYHNTVLTSGVLMHPRHTIMPMPRVASPDEYNKDAKDMDYVLPLDTVEYFIAAICVDDRYEYDPSREDRLLKVDQRIFEDVTVMFGHDAFRLERRSSTSG